MICSTQLLLLLLAAAGLSASTSHPPSHISFPLTQHKSSHRFAPHPAIPHASALHDLALGHGLTSASVDVAYTSAVYTITVGVGTPPQPQTLLIDTGSSDMLVFSAASKQCRSSSFGCGGGYNPVDSRTSKNLDMSFVFGFANQSATARGTFVRDNVHIGDFVVRDQPFAMIEDSVLDFDIEGVLGLGYKSKQQSDFKYETLASKITAREQTASTMRLLSRPRPVFSLYLGSRVEDVESGIDKQTHDSHLSAYFRTSSSKSNIGKSSLVPQPSLDLGFIDETKHTGDMLAFIPCTTADDFMIRVHDINFVDSNDRFHSLIEPVYPVSTAPVDNSDEAAPKLDMLLDSGTIGILIHDTVADAIAAAISADATYDESLPGYRLPCSAMSSPLQGHLEFSFLVYQDSTDSSSPSPSSSFETFKTIRVSLAELHRKFVSTSASNDGQCVLDVVRESTYGVGNILGTAFMSSVYAVFDVDRHRVGIAQAAYYNLR
ncbi:aspartic peptidase domain-containing protein [Myxozyma melibiosi]|uniref:Aspartic peptidase domain-containing protein n=1 Tax=Myxozyma melibiosi TaxID=54550 RepID=A0ABR1FAZ6_9ASCO